MEHNAKGTNVYTCRVSDHTNVHTPRTYSILRRKKIADVAWLATHIRDSVTLTEYTWQHGRGNRARAELGGRGGGAGKKWM